MTSSTRCAAVCAAQAQEAVGKDAAFEEGVELVFDELRQVAPGGHLCLGDEGGGVLLHQAVQRGQFRAVTLVVDRCAIRRPPGLPADGCPRLLGHLLGPRCSSDGPLRGDEFTAAYVADGSAAPARLFGLLTYRVHRMLIRVTRRWATALEIGRVRVPVGLWRLCFETGHCFGDFLVARMTGHDVSRPPQPHSPGPACPRPSAPSARAASSTDGPAFGAGCRPACASRRRCAGPC
jgi:hypothetical protein